MEIFLNRYLDKQCIGEVGGATGLGVSCVHCGNLSGRQLQPEDHGFVDVAVEWIGRCPRVVTLLEICSDTYVLVRGVKYNYLTRQPR